MANGSDLKERPIGELLKELSQQTSTLVRQEIELLKAELTEKGKQAGMGAAFFGGAGVIGFLTLAAFTTFLILALAEFMPGWVAALIVTVVYGAIAAVLAMRGKTKVQDATPPAPQTVETVKEDIQWAKNPTGSEKR